MNSISSDEETEPGRVNKTPRAAGKAGPRYKPRQSGLTAHLLQCPRTDEPGRRICFMEGELHLETEDLRWMPQSIWQSQAYLEINVFSPLQLTWMYPSFRFLWK